MSNPRFPRSISVDDPLTWTADLGYDYEFNAAPTTGTTTLPSGWSWVNQGTATYTEQYGAGKISVPATATTNYDWKLLVRSISASSSWTATAKFGWNLDYTTGNGYLCTLLLRDSASGKFVAFSLNRDGAFHAWKWTNATTYGNSEFTIPAVNLISPGGMNGMGYLRIKKNSSSSWDFLASVDGIAYAPLVKAVDISAFLTTPPDQFGIGFHCTNSRDGEMACHWFRVR